MTKNIAKVKATGRRTSGGSEKKAIIILVYSPCRSPKQRETKKPKTTPPPHIILTYFLFLHVFVFIRKSLITDDVVNHKSFKS